MAERDRLSTPSLMDIMGARDTETSQVSAAGQFQTSPPGMAADHGWLHMAISIEELQYVSIVIFYFPGT
jgi:hypothetical protein